MPSFSPVEKARTLKLIRSRLDHDLRSNLNVILGYCSMLKEELSSRQVTPGMIEDLGFIEAAGKDLLQMNDRIGDLVALQEGEWKPANTGLDLDRIVDAIAHKLSARFPGLNIELNGSANLDHGDSAATTRLLFSIMDALCRATSVVPGLSIELSASGDDATVDVRCIMDAAPEPEQRKLVRILEGLQETVSELTSIQDFDNYYCSTMRELTGAEVHTDVKHLACRVRFRDIIDHAEATDSDNPAG